MMDKKFCIKCGKEIQVNAEFCPFCGTSQDSSSVAATDEAPKPQINEIDLTVQPTKAFGRTADSVPDRVNEYRAAIGFTDEAPYVYGYFQNTGAVALLGPLGVASQKYFILSMEKDGLLTLGMNMKEKFNGKNAFVKFSDIDNIKVSNHGLNYHLVIKTGQGKLKASVVKYRIGQPWQKENAKILADKLPTINQELA